MSNLQGTNEFWIGWLTNHSQVTNDNFFLTYLIFIEFDGFVYFLFLPVTRKVARLLDSSVEICCWKIFRNFEENYKNVNCQECRVFSDTVRVFLNSVSLTWLNRTILVAEFCHLDFTTAKLLGPEYASDPCLDLCLSEHGEKWPNWWKCSRW